MKNVKKNLDITNQILEIVDKKHEDVSTKQLLIEEEK